MPALDKKACYRALQSRDARFDGRIFVGVTSTGIYCRPICSARTPKFENCRFFPSAAAAQEAGFRPCLRCRPEAAPGIASWRGTSNTVARGLALIAEGALDSGEAGVEALAERLGVGGRQLRRLFQQHLGTTPVAVAQTNRILFAKQLIHQTRLPMADIALAAGFGSVRRFNEVFLRLFHRPPSSLRRRASSPTASASETGVTLRLTYRPPYDWDCILEFLRARAIKGIERVEQGRYMRTVLEGGSQGTVEVSHAPQLNSLSVRVCFPELHLLPVIVARVRRVFDLDADVSTIGRHLAVDPFLAPLIAKHPGLRVPGAWDGFELAVRAILGQQITVELARQLAGSLVALCGKPMPSIERAPNDLAYTFPTPGQLLATNLSSLKMPGSRKRTLLALAEVVSRNPKLFEPFHNIDAAVARLREIPGIGDWTAHYIALRALRETDAFPASDVGLLRRVATAQRERPTPEKLLFLAEPWRPWRGYAAQHLWTADSASGALPISSNA
jgi:AraC family transcriptional regulator, regulatory protein of adaptative response / DNA-3-methyladenine glycosylase II